MPANTLDDRKSCDDPAAPDVAPLPPGIAPGASVTLRGERWRLESTVTHADCRELHLSRATDSHTRILLWPFDRPSAVDMRPRVRAVRLRQWAAAVLPRASMELEPLGPRVSSSPAVDVMPFQLAPAVTMAQGVSRIVLADEVGLGKTIQAGWIIADVVTRDPAARVLLAVPAGLRQQWVTELTTRFGLSPTPIDAHWLRRAAADLPADVSPWLRAGVYVGSLDFVKRPDVADSIARHVWDALVIDEAHTATAPTDRHAALVKFAARARRVIAITATPNSGNASGFASLTTLGATRDSDLPVMFRRSRQDVGDARMRRHHFVRVRITRAETRLQRLLERYSRDVWTEAVHNVENARLAVTILRKRALSSPAAAARSLRRRLALLQNQAPPPLQLHLFEDDDAVDDDIDPLALATPGLADAAREHRLLASLIEAADASQGSDSKLRYLRRLICRAGHESMVIFTEYRDTLMQLAGALPPTLQLHGGLSAAERAHVQERFNREGGLLLATDAAAEGLNLHQRCRVIVNYELPWNPARLEQRIGRVDRIGQRRTVHALTLTARDTAEDLVLKNLARRLLRVVATLGAGDRLGAFLDDVRTAGIVIGGEAAGDETEAEPGTDALVIRDDGNLRRAAEVARHLSARTRMANSAHASGARSSILVSSIRAREGLLEPGYVVTVACAARTEDGFTAAERHVVMHLRSAAARPRSARAARRIAEALLQGRNARTLVPDADRWFEGVREAHDTAVRGRIARERAISARDRVRGALQAGLFDHRAVAAADLHAASEERLTQEHRRHIATLERSRRLHLTCGVWAVLVAWR